MLNHRLAGFYRRSLPGGVWGVPKLFLFPKRFGENALGWNGGNTHGKGPNWNECEKSVQAANGS